MKKLLTMLLLPRKPQSPKPSKLPPPNSEVRMVYRLGS